jgi:hypothetical protein
MRWSSASQTDLIDDQSEEASTFPLYVDGCVRLGGFGIHIVSFFLDLTPPRKQCLRLCFPLFLLVQRLAVPPLVGAS